MKKRKFRDRLRVIVEDNTSIYGKVFDYFIQILILISLLSFAIETLPNNSAAIKVILKYIDLFCVGIFTVEYLSRVYVAKKPFKYISSFYGIIDLLAILPFYIRTAVDLRAIRAFRVFRIFRALKLIRFNKALQRFQLAAKIVREEVILFLIITSIIIFISASGIYYFENTAQPKEFASVFHSFWWAIVTLTTVGYGDVYPITIGGKIFTFFVILTGVGVVTVPAGLVATALSKAREIQEEENQNKSNYY